MFWRALKWGLPQPCFNEKTGMNDLYINILGFAYFEQLDLPSACNVLLGPKHGLSCHSGNE